MNGVRLKRLAILLISPPEYIYYMILAFPPARRDIQIFTAICFVLEGIVAWAYIYRQRTMAWNELLHYGYLSPFNGAVGKSNSCENVLCSLYTHTQYACHTHIYIPPTAYSFNEISHLIIPYFANNAAMLFIDYC